MNHKSSLAGLFALLLFTAVPHAAWCMALTQGAAGRVRTVPAQGVPLLPAPGLSKATNNPALSGGIPFSVLPGLQNPRTPGVSARSGARSAAPVGLTPSLSLPTILPAAHIAAPVRRVAAITGAETAGRLSKTAPLATPNTGSASFGKKPAIKSVKSFAAGIRGAQSGRGAGISGRSRAFFDGSLKSRHEDSEVDAAGASFETFGRHSKLARLAEKNNALSRLYPRTVFMLDTFPGEVPKATISLIEDLLNNNVHVVFITPRPAKGPNSADLMLVSKIKPRTGNPLLVASYNGANITVRNSRADNPKPIVEDVPGFPEATVEKFRAISAKLRQEFGFRGQVKEFGLPEAAGALIYGAELPNKTADIKAWTAAYNKALKSARLPYRVETGVNANGRPYFFIQSSDLRLNSERLFNALNKRFPDLKGSLKPSEILVLGDMKKAGAFVQALPGKGYHLYGVSDEASMHDALASVLGNKSYKQIRVTRSKIRAYLSWELRKNRTYKRGGSGKGSNRTGGMHKNLGFYRGIIVYNLMPKLYRLIRKGQFEQATLEAATDLLRRMWYNPMSEWVRINDELEAARRSPIWKSMEKGYLESTRVWLANYYKRNFANYPRNLGEEVIGKLINTHMDIGNGISLGFTSPFTDNRYIVKVLPNRVFLEYDDKGPVLVAHVDRSGREPYQAEFDESMETNMLARATLKGYGELRSNGLWYVNDEANPRVKIIYHYNTRDLSHIYTPAELEANSAKLTALIDRMQADEEFLAHFEAEKKKNETLTDAAKKRKREQADAKKHAQSKKRRAAARIKKAKRGK